MPKRNNPFGDVSSLQLKTHVGVKEVDNGVCQQTRMQSVYERTHQLLFSGAKRENGSVANCERMEVIEMGFKNNDNMNSLCRDPADGKNQMRLNKNCELVVSSDNAMETGDSDAEKEVLSIPTLFPASCKFGDQDFCQSLFPSDIRASRELSPPLPLSSSHLPMSDGCDSKVEGNAFARLLQAQRKPALITNSCVFSVRACNSCRAPVQSKDVMKCQFCENYVCKPCTQQCQRCFLHFCQLCSVLNYSQEVERAFCLSCSSK